VAIKTDKCLAVRIVVYVVWNDWFADEQEMGEQILTHLAAFFIKWKKQKIKITFLAGKGSSIALHFQVSDFQLRFF
jgi:hypothetical protein